MRIQSKMRGRKPLHSGVQKEINRRIETLAHRFDCSKSFVANTLLAEALNIDIDERFYEGRATTRETEGTKKESRVLYFDDRGRARWAIK